MASPTLRHDSPCRVQSIRAVDLLVTGRAPTPADRFAGPRMLLLDRLRGMMDLGWQAPVQADGESRMFLMRDVDTAFRQPANAACLKRVGASS